MSCNYAESLSPYENKGTVGMPEIFDNEQQLEEKSIRLAKFLKQSQVSILGLVFPLLVAFLIFAVQRECGP